jgi:hypothetical protein
MGQHKVAYIIRNGRLEVMDCIIDENDVVELFAVLSGG